MQSTGLVMSINKNHACVMTPLGDFMRIKISNGKIPIIGQVYTGIVVNRSALKSRIFVKYKALAASFIFFVFISYGLYSYFTPVTAATIDINPSIKLSCNKYSKIIYMNALNDDGKKILSGITIKNLNLDEALVKIIDQSINDNFINSKYLNGKSIFLNITGKEVSVVNFEKKLEEKKLTAEIKTNGNIKEIKGNAKNNSINTKDKQTKAIDTQINCKLNNNVKSNNSIKSNNINSVPLNIKEQKNSNIKKQQNTNKNGK